MTSSIERFFISPNYDPRVVTQGINSFLEEGEGVDWIVDLTPRLNQPANQGRPKELYQRISEGLISKIYDFFVAGNVLLYAGDTKNYYILNRLLNSFFVIDIDSVISTFVRLAKQGDLIGLEMVLQSPRKAELTPENFSAALRASARTGQIAVVQRLLEPDLIAMSIEGIYEAIKSCPGSPNWQAIFELLIDYIPEAERSEILSEMGQYASKSEKVACLRYLFRKNLVQNWDDIFKAANGPCLDFFLNPKLPIPLSEYAIRSCIDNAMDCQDPSTTRLVKLLSSQKAALHFSFHLPFHVIDFAYEERLRIVDRYSFKLPWQNLTENLSQDEISDLFNKAVQYSCFRILKSLADRADVLIDLDPKPFRLEESVDVCRNSGRYELADQLDSIVSQRNRRDNECVRRISRNIRRISHDARNIMETVGPIGREVLEAAGNADILGFSGRQAFTICLIYFTAEKAFQIYRWANS